MSKSDKKLEVRNGSRSHYAVVNAPESGKHFQKKPNHHGMNPAIPLVDTIKRMKEQDAK